MTPQKRAMEELRKSGYSVDIVERWVPVGGKWPGVRKDLFGCLDLVAIKVGRTGVLGVQVTTLGQHSRRVKKVREEPRMRPWLLSGNRLWVMSWGKPEGGKRWEKRITKLSLRDLP